MDVAPSFDEMYLNIILRATGVCRNYKPKFGVGGNAGLLLEEFQQLYRTDHFYTWFGLDSPLIYAAHKAAGGITSIYRQIGTGCEELFRKILENQLGLTPLQSKWFYQIPSVKEGVIRKLSLDGRINLLEIKDQSRKNIVKDWLDLASERVGLEKSAATHIVGSVFEIRQGYKSKDSKRQNADIANAANAYANDYIPVLTLFSSQIDSDIEERYVRAQWLILKGSLSGTPLDSTYAFCREILGFDLAAFFERNSSRIKAELEKTIRELLKNDA